MSVIVYYMMYFSLEWLLIFLSSVNRWYWYIDKDMFKMASSLLNQKKAVNTYINILIPCSMCSFPLIQHLLVVTIVYTTLCSSLFVTLLQKLRYYMSCMWRSWVIMLLPQHFFPKWWTIQNRACVYTLEAIRWANVTSPVSYIRL
jgi:hypothetical protein